MEMSKFMKLRIIIIDDDPAVNLMLKTALTNLGHHVLSFSDPTACPLLKMESCSCPQEFPCADVIISDIDMPNMSGIDLFKLQKQRGCKAVFENKALVSGTIKKEHFDAIKQLGCKFFHKPFKLVDLTRWVEECAKRIPKGRVLAKLG